MLIINLSILKSKALIALLSNSYLSKCNTPVLDCCIKTLWNDSEFLSWHSTPNLSSPMDQSQQRSNIWTLSHHFICYLDGQICFYPFSKRRNNILTVLSLLLVLYSLLLIRKSEWFFNSYELCHPFCSKLSAGLTHTHTKARTQNTEIKILHNLVVTWPGNSSLIPFTLFPTFATQTHNISHLFLSLHAFLCPKPLASMVLCPFNSQLEYRMYVAHLGISSCPNHLIKSPY